MVAQKSKDFGGSSSSSSSSSNTCQETRADAVGLDIWGGARVNVCESAAVAGRYSLTVEEDRCWQAVASVSC